MTLFRVLSAALVLLAGSFSSAQTSVPTQPPPAACAPSAVAGEPPLTVDTPATSAQIRRWLGADDPCLTAWGATYAAQRRDPVLLEAVASTLDSRLEAEASGDEERLALSALADALLTTSTPVPEQTLERLGPVLPGSAVVLAARSDPSVAAKVFATWFNADPQGRKGSLSRIAAMFLAHNPPPGFAAAILYDAERSVSVWVTTSDTSKFSLGCGGANGSYLAVQPIPGWPEVFTYTLSESDSDSPGSLIKADGDHINAFRQRVFRTVPANSDIVALSPYTRWKLLAAMLGSEEAVGWRHTEQLTIRYQNHEQYLSDLGKLVANSTNAFRETALALHHKGYLTDEELEHLPALTLRFEIDKDVPAHP